MAHFAVDGELQVEIVDVLDAVFGDERADGTRCVEALEQHDRVLVELEVDGHVESEHVAENVVHYVFFFDVFAAAAHHNA